MTKPPTRRANAFLRKALRGIGALFSLAIALVASRYLTGDPDVFFPQQREAYSLALPMLMAHVGGAIVALVLGPFQLAERLRLRLPQLHRAMGVTYVFAIAVAGIAGFRLAASAYGGRPSTLGLGCLAVLWLGATAVVHVYGADTPNTAAGCSGASRSRSPP